MQSRSEGTRAAIKRMRTKARVISVIYSAFILLIGVGEALEGRSRPGPPLTPIAALGLGLLFLYVMGLLLAIKWERVGSLLGVTALGIIFILLLFRAFPGGAGGFTLRGVLNPALLLLWLPLVLYVRCWTRAADAPPGATASPA